MRNTLTIILLLITHSQSVLAVQLIEGLPNAFQPGTPITFDVRLPPISNLGAYNIDLVLESTAGTAGVDYFFDAAATVPAVTNYVFPTSANFFDAVNVDSPSRHRITLSDFDLSGVNILAGQNDRVATVVLRTEPDFGNPLSLFVDAPSLILDTPGVVPTPVSGFNTIQTDIASAGATGLLPVPEPKSAAAIIAGFALTLASCRRNRSFRIEYGVSDYSASPSNHRLSNAPAHALGPR